ncbi:MAG: hypothetical protein K2W78_05240 [Xanthobacteraceae bacterium]|nr:hypothetical protein [Xanthobacteraceae bacterium]
MPTFTFEKISPAGRPPGPTMAVMTQPGGVVRPRGVIVQLLDRLAESRIRRSTEKRDVSFTENDIRPRR